MLSCWAHLRWGSIIYFKELKNNSTLSWWWQSMSIGCDNYSWVMIVIVIPCCFMTCSGYGYESYRSLFGILLVVTIYMLLYTNSCGYKPTTKSFGGTTKHKDLHTVGQFWMECTQLCTFICGVCMCIYLYDMIYTYIYDIYIYTWYTYIYDICIELPYITNWNANPDSFFSGKTNKRPLQI